MRRVAIAVVLASLIHPVILQAKDDVPLWGRWERTFTSAQAATWRTDFRVELTSPSGIERVAFGFWDGGKTWRVRFRPDEKGQWKYKTRCIPAVAGLDGVAGTFDCIKPEAANRFFEHGPVRIAEAGTYLEHADGTPFFWLGDTAWCGPALSARDDWATYLEDRARKKFSVVQFNAVCPWRTAPADAEGRTAFTGQKNIEINPDYFRRLDERMDAINAKGLLAAPVLIWANKPSDPGNVLPEEDVIRLARYQTARYGAHHEIWILAGDNPYRGDAVERWKRIGRGVFGGLDHAPVTTHPTGMNYPWEDFKNEKWLDILGYQSGHGDDARTLRWMQTGPPSANWRKPPPRPIINLELPYENHLAYQSRQPHSAHNVRRAAYWSLLATPVAGITYGGHGIWSWQTEEGKEPRDHQGTGVAPTWRQALALPGSVHMRHLADLFASIPWQQLRPNQDWLAEQPGGNDAARYVAAASAPRKDLGLVYLPVGGEVTLRGGVVADDARAEWFDPRTGKRSPAAGENRIYRAPDGQDWVLLLQKK